MQCPLCNQVYSSGKFCTSCESPDGGAVRLIESERQVDPADLDQYIKMLDVFLSDGFFSPDEKETLGGLRQQYGISEQQHQAILKENGYNYRETMPVRMVLNRKTIQGYGAGQPCLAKVRLVNMERMPLQKVEIRYWLNSEEVHTSTIRQLMPNKVQEVDLDFIPQKSGQYALKMELTVDPFVGEKTEYVVESTSFQVYSQSQLQSVHIHQSADNIVGNHKVHGTDMPQAMLLGDGQWDERVISPKQRAVEWGEWTSQRLFTKVSAAVSSASEKYQSILDFQAFVNGLSLERKEGEDFIVWEERLFGVARSLEELTTTIGARLEREQQEREAEQHRKKAEQERKAREEAERKRKEEEEQRRLTKEGEALYRDIEKLLDKPTYEVKQESDFKTLSTTCKKLRKPTGRQTLQTWVKKLRQTKADLPKQLSDIAEARKKRLEAERKAKEAEEARKERECQAKLKREEEKRKEAERKARKKKEDELTILKLRYVRLLEQADKAIEEAFDPVGLTQFKSSLRAKIDLAEKKGLDEAIEFLQGIDDWSTREWMKQCQLDADRKRAEEERLRKIQEEKERQERAEAERQRKERERIEAEKRRKREEAERKEREAREKAKREKEEREREVREEAERKRKAEAKRRERKKQARIEAERKVWAKEGNRQRSLVKEVEPLQIKAGGVFGFGAKVVAEYPMVKIPTGWFMMGALEDDGEAFKSEKLRHKVTLTRAFLMGKYPVTQAMWESVMGLNPSKFKGANRPVEQVSWFDCVLFCNKLSNREGLEPVYTINGENVTCNWNAKGYRLPTEAEWEYSARSGQRFKYAGSTQYVNAVAWYDGNSRKETHPVGQKKPNGFGLYDMSGNVWEWVWDRFGDYSSDSQTDPTGPDRGPYRVVRGGSWATDARGTRLSLRGRGGPAVRFDDLGFRLVLTP